MMSNDTEFAARRARERAAFAELMELEGDEGEVDLTQPRGVLRTNEQRSADKLAGFHVAWGRLESDLCEKGTPGCCVAFHDEHEECETW